MLLCQTLKLDPTLLRILTDGLHWGFQLEMLPVENYPTECVDLLQEQNEIFDQLVLVDTDLIRQNEADESEKCHT